MSTTSISPQQLQELIESGQTFELLDVRTPAEFEDVHIAAARNVPLDRLYPEQLAMSRATPVHLICWSGTRSKQASEKLSAAGFQNVLQVEGGTKAWEEAGLPVVRGRKAISLERQVRIAAGSIVFAGTMLGIFLNPWLLGLPAFVGAGLIFAGVTDTCGMGMLLAKMPWNQVKPSPATETPQVCSIRRPA